MKINKKKLTEALVAWYYQTDLILDESDLDAFHDKSVVTKQAELLADALTTIKQIKHFS